MLNLREIYEEFTRFLWIFYGGEKGGNQLLWVTN